MAVTVDEAIAGFKPALPAAVAFSGGADSTALLAACARAWPGEIQAIHVHHGLQAAADDFMRHCEKVCAEWKVPLRVEHVNARAASGGSPEEAARDARYIALARAATASGAASVLLAQHADDQVETILLALSRGAGLPGLAAMPRTFERHGARFDRPLLDVGAQEVRDWLQAHSLQFIDDPTNMDTSFTRNRIRHHLVPALSQAFPQYRDTFARSARHAAQGQELLTALATADLAGTGDPPSIESLRALTRARQANLLRHWLRSVHAVDASAAQLEELLDQVAACTTRGHHIRIKVGTGFVERNKAHLGFKASGAP